MKQMNKKDLFFAAVGWDQPVIEAALAQRPDPAGALGDGQGRSARDLAREKASHKLQALPDGQG